MSSTSEQTESLGMLLDVPAAVFPAEVAVSGPAGSLTYGRLRARSAAWAAWLADAAGDGCVAYVGSLTPRFVELLFGCAYASIPIMPVNYRLTSAELAKLLGRVTATVVIADRRNEPKVSDALRDLPGVRLITGDWAPADDSGGGKGEEQSQEQSKQAREERGRGTTRPAAVLLATSGTTSEPKVVTLTHGNLLHYVTSTVDAVSAERGEAALLAVPPYHIAAIAQLLSNVFRARRAVLHERFDPVEWLEAVRSERITHAMVVPTMLARIVEALAADPSLTPRTLQTLTYGGARSPAGLVGRAVAHMPAVGFVNAFGLTEASSTVCVLTPADHRAAIASADESVRRRLDSVGRPVPGVEISIQAGRGELLGAGEVGEICIRGGQVVTDYIGAKADIDPDGWLHTSDAGYLDEDGYLFVKGRQDDVIIRGGENIDPAEIEDLILRHPAFKDAAAVALPDPEWGEIVGLLAVLNPGYDMDLATLSSWLRGRLAGYKIPAAFEVIEELPRNELGKLVRRRVAQQFARTDPGRQA